MIITPQSLKNLFIGFSAKFKEGFPLAPADWEKIAMKVESTGAATTYGWLGQFPRFREWAGARVLKDLKAHSYTLINKPFESTVKVGRDEIEDDLIGTYGPLMKEMGRAAADFPNELVFSLLQLGFTTPCYDGQNFFDANHPVAPNVDGTGTPTLMSNNGGGTGAAWYLLDTSKAIKPLILQERRAAQFIALNNANDDHAFKNNEYLYGVDGRWNSGFALWQLAYGSKQPLTVAAFEAAMDAMCSFKSDGGRPMGIKPTILVVSRSLRAAAEAILSKELIGGGESNTNYKRVELIVSDWL
jgi:phage major head subunit gpT-like protein